MSKKDRPKLSETQLQLMSIIWEKGNATVTDVWEALPDERRVARTTVMTLMVRLADKGWLKRTKSGNEYMYSPTEPKEKVLGSMISRLIKNAFGNSTANLMLALFNSRGISREEAAHLKKIIEDAEKKK